MRHCVFQHVAIFEAMYRVVRYGRPFTNRQITGFILNYFAFDTQNRFLRRFVFLEAILRRINVIALSKETIYSRSFITRSTIFCYLGVPLSANNNEDGAGHRLCILV